MAFTQSSVDCGACGAKLPPPDAQTGAVVCKSCHVQYEPAFEPFPVGGTVPPPTEAPPFVNGNFVERSDAEVLELATQMLGRTFLFSIQGNIPSDREARAREAYGALLSSEEPLIALYDSTDSGTGEYGFAITSKRLVGRVRDQDPVMVEWATLKTEGARAEHNNLFLQNQQFQAKATDERAARTLLEFARVMVGDQPAPSPARKAHKDVAVRKLPARLDPDVLLVVLRRTLLSNKDLFFAPDIPPAKEKGARSGYGSLLPENEPILVLHDSTFFGGADNGFIVTANHFGFKNLGRDPNLFRWDELPITTEQLNSTNWTTEFGALHIDIDSSLGRRLRHGLRDLMELP